MKHSSHHLQGYRGVEPRGINSRGGSRAWGKLVKQVCREEPVCSLRLRGCTMCSTTADHVIPRKLRPDLNMDRRNLRGACRNCNLRKGDRMLHELTGLRQQQRPARALGYFR